MADRLELAFRLAASASIPARASVVVAVSGGSDSVALLHLLRRSARAREWRLNVSHLDHGMRRGSRADRRFVEALTRDLGLPCLADRREVPALRRRGESPEEAARRVRREFLLACAEKVGASRIALGHTLDDQAETVLLRLVRGAGPAALAGMTPEGPGPFVRPLLGLEREALRGWLRRLGIPFREDPTNRKIEADRNRLRHRVLPRLREINPQAARHVAEAAARLRADASWLDGEAAGFLPERSPGGELWLDAKTLASLPPPLASRVARGALTRAGCDPRHVNARHVEALLALARGGGRARLDLPTGVEAVRRRNLLELRGRRKGGDLRRTPSLLE